MSETLFLSAGDTIRSETYLSASDVWSYPVRTLTGPVTISGNVTLDPSTRVVLAASQPDLNPATNTQAQQIYDRIGVPVSGSISQDIQNIATTVVQGVPANFLATSGTLPTGTNITGSYVNTWTVNSVYWTTAPVTPAVGGFGLNQTLIFNCGSSRVSQISIVGRFQAGAARAVDLWAYNYATSAYDSLSNSVTRMNNTGTDATYTYTLLPNHQSTSGDCIIRFTSTSTTVGDRLNIDQILLKAVEAGATAAEIADAVWSHDISTHLNHTEAGFFASRAVLDVGTFVSITGANVTITGFTCNISGAYNGLNIEFHEEGTSNYEIRRIVNYVGNGVVTMDRAPYHTLSGDYDAYILGFVNGGESIETVLLDPSVRVVLSASQPDYTPALQSTLLAGIASITGSQALIITKEDNITGSQATIIIKVDNLSGGHVQIISKEDSISASIAALGTPMQAGTAVVLSASQPNYTAALQSTLLAGIESITGSQVLIISKEDSISGNQATIITKIDNISADTNSLKNGQITIISKEDSISASIAALGTPVQTGTKVVLSASQPDYAPAKASDVANALTNYDGGNGVAKEVSVLSIQNNTRFVSSIPGYLLVPVNVSADVYKFAVNFYDTSGTMEDPDSDDLAIYIETAGSVSKNAYLFQDYACTTALTASSNFPSSKALVRMATGRYECYFKSISGADAEQLMLTFSLVENGTDLFYSRTTMLLLEEPGTSVLADNNTNKDIIAKALKTQDVQSVSAVIGSIYQDFIDSINQVDTDVISTSGLATGIKAQTDKFLFDVNNYVLSKIMLSDNIDFTALQKTSLNNATPIVTGATLAGEVVLSANQPSYPVAKETNATLNTNEILEQITTISGDVWNNVNRTLTSLSGVPVDLTTDALVSMRNVLWNATLQYLDETGTEKQAEAWIMLQAIFSTIKQRLTRK